MQALPHLLNISLNIPEIIFFQVAALIVGFVSHYLWSIRNGDVESGEIEFRKLQDEIAQWRRKFYEAADQLKENGGNLQQQLQQAQQQTDDLRAELEELQLLNQELMSRSKTVAFKPEEAAYDAPVAENLSINTNAYALQLKQAQEYLQGHNQAIEQLLSQLQQLETARSQYDQALIENEELGLQVYRLQQQLQQQQSENLQLQQRAQLSGELQQQLQQTYHEFHALQEKMKQLESQLGGGNTSAPQRVYELEENNRMLKQELEQYRGKEREQMQEGIHLQQQLQTAQHQVRDLQLRCEQLEKRKEFTDNFSNELKSVSEQNKKLEEQLARISQMEAQLQQSSSGTSSYITTGPQ